MKIINTNTDADYIEQTITVLKNGGLVIAPSDTVYGLLVDATNESAVRKLLAFKNRPIGKPISVFLPDFQFVTQYVSVKPDQNEILKKFLPGPFTVILPSFHKVSHLLESEKGTLGIRVIDNTIINTLGKGFGKPFTATSANISGKKPHHSVESFLATLSQKKKDLIDIILDAGTLPRNKPSTIIDLSGSDIKILRKGDVLFDKQYSYISTSANQTKKLGQYLLNKYLPVHEEKPLVFIIEGDLGVGKTILAKGIGEELGIHNIISPTFVVYYEYPISYKSYKYFIHGDLYNIQEEEEFNHLGLEQYLKGKNILCFEWGERMGKLYDTIRTQARVIYIKMEHSGELERKITVFT